MTINDENRKRDIRSLEKEKLSQLIDELIGEDSPEPLESEKDADVE